MDKKILIMNDIKELISIIQEAAFEVRNHLLPGYLENVYKNALLLELRSRGIKVETEKEVDVKYKGTKVGKYRIDLMVEDLVILELKAVSSLTSAHTFQLINYLTATEIDNGVLINYGEKFQFQHKTRFYYPSPD
ncbi:MAG: GxxExxY protein [Muribaculaceae bacterium]|nr:GxxExxY protein [Muribaculaceae bacterium]